MQSTDADLISQQHRLAASAYDLRISNLARFLWKKTSLTYQYDRRQSDSTWALEGGRDSGFQGLRDARVQQLSNPVNSKQTTVNSAVVSQWVSGLVDKWFGKKDCCMLHATGYINHATRYRLLDVGAGNGLILKFFRGKGFEVSGVELEQELVERMKNDSQLKGVSIRQGSITEMQGDSSYDVVIASDVIEHIKDDIKALNRLWSFVKPGGQLVITVPAFQMLYGKRDEAWGHFRRYDRALMRDHIGKAKLNNVKTIQMCYWNIVGFFAYAFYEKILGKPINESVRKSTSPLSRFIRCILECFLRVEEYIGGLPFGLTLVCVMKKSR